MSGDGVDTGTIRWRLRLKAAPEEVYSLLATAEGRQRFWAESAREVRGRVLFEFPNGESLHAELLEAERPRRFAIRYFGGSRAQFDLESAEPGGTLLTLTESGVPAAALEENRAGWVSVLLGLKAAADHGVDLRNHDPRYCWDEGFVDN